MKHIRIGKDITLRWPILTNGEEIALEGRDLTLILITPSGRKEQREFVVVDGNVIQMVYHGIEHERTGKHSLTLWENYGLVGQTAVDKTDAFCLVSTTDLED